MGPVGRTDRPDLAVLARGLAARYRGRVALDEVDLDVAFGEIVGILGPNGAGKTSLLRVLATGRRPAAGTLALLGNDARRPTAGLRRSIGVAGDDAVHVDALTGRENAVLFARASGLARSDAARCVRELLSRLALDAEADRPVAEYSLGMRRKLLLLEALVHAPRLIVLDEPTTGLDPQGREALRGLLRERAGRGAAVVLASNDVAEAERLCGRVVFLRAGRKVLEGAPRDLIARLVGATRFELRLRAPRAPDIRCPDVEVAVATAERLVAHARDGSAPLPALCEAVLRAGAAIEAVEVRQPDLGDVYLRATGEELTGEPVPPSPGPPTLR